MRREPRVGHQAQLGLNPDRCSHHKMRLLTPTPLDFVRMKMRLFMYTIWNQGRTPKLQVCLLFYSLCPEDKDRSLHCGLNCLSDLPASFSSPIYGAPLPARSHHTNWLRSPNPCAGPLSQRLCSMVCLPVQQSCALPQPAWQIHTSLVWFSTATPSSQSLFLLMHP